MTIERAPEFPRPVTIEQVENGYMMTVGETRERIDRMKQGYLVDAAPVLVFPSKAALFAHLAEHFTHEAVSVPMDKAPPPVLGTLPAGTIVSKEVLDEMQRTGACVGAGFTNLAQERLKAEEAIRNVQFNTVDVGYVSGQGFTEFGRRE